MPYQSTPKPLRDQLTSNPQAIPQPPRQHIPTPAKMAFPTNKTFNPFNQTIVILAPDGKTPLPIPLSFVREVQVSTTAMGIVQGTQIGAAALLLTCLFLNTKADKRRSVLFLLNALALFLVVLRGIFSAVAFTGPFFDWYSYSTLYYANLHAAQTVSIAAALMSLTLIIVLEMSIVLQVRIVCCTVEPTWRHIITLFNTLLALSVIGLQLALNVLTIRWNILGVLQQKDWQFERINKLASVANITFVISLGISVAIFCAKLAFAIRRRRSMGMKQFGPMQVIFIMGFQTMILPCKPISPTLPAPQSKASR